MKEHFLQEFENIIADIQARHFVLAVSGGVDSVALAWLFKEADLPFSIAHCNFKLRGIESDKDESFVSSLAKELGVECHVKSFDTAEFASKNGISIQMAARELRYQWFETLITNDGTFLVTAHHSNDVAETMLFNLAKGTGLAGLHGIRRFDGNTIRPLLWASKQDILLYAKEQKFEWREDLSNDDVKYSRNRIRNNILPQFEEINSAFVSAVGRTGERVMDAEKLIDYFIEQKDLKRTEGRFDFINKKKLLELPGNSTVLYRLISNYGFSYDQVDAILRSIDSVGASFLSNTAVLNIDREELIISHLNDETIAETTINKDQQEVRWGRNKLKLKVIKRDVYKLSPNPDIAGLDFSKLIFPLTLREYREGDKFQPLGMTGSKLISDFLIDEKVPVPLKKEQAIVLSGNEIVWIVGKRIDDRFKITESTTEVFELRLENA